MASAEGTKLIPGTVKDYGSFSTQGLRDEMEDDLHLSYNENLEILYCGVFDGWVPCYRDFISSALMSLKSLSH
jgi:hypothetical protein